MLSFKCGTHTPNRKKLGEISGVKSLNDESPYEDTKPLKWTLTASQDGVIVQSGMLVKIDVSSTGFKGEGIVQYIGKENVVVEIDGVEEMLHCSCIRPFDDIKTFKDVQREEVVDYLTKDCGIVKRISEAMYDDLFDMGVFKEEK